MTRTPFLRRSVAAAWATAALSATCLAGGEVASDPVKPNLEPLPAPAAQQQGGYAGADHTVAIDLAAIQLQTFQPCVGWVVVLNGELRGRDFRLVDGKNPS